MVAGGARWSAVGGEDAVGLPSAHRWALPRPAEGKKGAAAGESSRVGVVAGAGVVAGEGRSWGPAGEAAGAGGADVGGASAVMRSVGTGEQGSVDGLLGGGRHGEIRLQTTDVKT